MLANLRKLVEQRIFRRPFTGYSEKKMRGPLPLDFLGINKNKDACDWLITTVKEMTEWLENGENKSKSPVSKSVHQEKKSEETSSS